jgi:hypothetical protein
MLLDSFIPDAFCLRFSTHTLLFDLIQQFLRQHLLLLFASRLHGRFGSANTGTVFLILFVRPKYPVPPPERGSVVVRKSHVVEIVVISARPEGDDVLE